MNKEKKIAMSKCSDNIHERKDGRWEGLFRKGCKPDGSIIDGFLYGKAYKEVRSKLSELPKVEQNLRLHQNHEKAFGEILSLWIEHNRICLKGGTLTIAMLHEHIKDQLPDICPHLHYGCRIEIYSRRQ